MKTCGIVFDFGGVLTTTTAPMRVKEAVEARGLPWSAVLNGFATMRREYDLGEITVAEFYDRVWKAAGVDVPQDARRVIEAADTESFLYRNERTIGWMRSLKARGLRLGILTNMPHELVPGFRERFADCIAMADGLVISCEERIVKPMREIYALMEARIGLEGETLCLLDDSEANCAGARAAGWRAVRFAANGQAEEEVEGMLAK